MIPNPRKRLAHVLRQYNDPELLGDVAYVVAHTFGVNEPPPGQEQQEYEHGFTQAIRSGDTEAILSYFPERLPNDEIVGWFARELRKISPLRPLDAVAQRSDIMGSIARSHRRERREWLRNEMARKGASVLQWYELVRPRPQLLQLSWPEVEERVARELDDLTAKVEVDQGVVVMEWEDGWTMQELPVGCLDAEGQIMQHCVGRGGYDEAVASGATRIFSLRDPANKPHVTIEYNVQGRKFVQVMGKQNRAPAPQYAGRVRQFMDLNPMLFTPETYLSSLRLLGGSAMVANGGDWRRGRVLGGMDSNPQTGWLGTPEVLALTGDVRIYVAEERRMRDSGHGITRAAHKRPFSWVVYNDGKAVGLILNRTLEALKKRGLTSVHGGYRLP